MIRKLYTGKVNAQTGKFEGLESEQLRSDFKGPYAGQWVTIQVTVHGSSLSPAKLRGWYFAGILPSLLTEMRKEGHDVDPEDQFYIDWLHDLLKRTFLAPEKDSDGRVKLDDNGGLIYTLKGKDLKVWKPFIDNVLGWAWDTFGINLDPDKPKKRHHENFRS